MDGFENVSTQDNSGPKHPTSASAASPDGCADADNSFNQRLEDWMKEASKHPDPQLACVGMVNAKTAQIVDQNAVAILHSMEQFKPSTSEEPAIQGAISTHNGLLRQWTSMMNFQARLEKMHRDAVAEMKIDPLRQIPR